MTATLIYAIILFLPAGVSNMTPILASRLPGLRGWNAPIDFGKNFRGKRIFGPHKTWRGLITGVIAGSVVGVAMFGPVALLPSAAMSFGALLGDALESFFKRQRGIDSGKSWFPFDQTDYIIGGLLFLLPFGVLSKGLVLWILVLYFGLHLISSYVGYLLGFKKTPI